MPVPTERKLAAFIKKHGRYRLACSNCFRDDFDGVKSLPKSWEGINREQSLKDALSTYDDPGDPPAPKGYSVLDWWTHIGLCPECQD